jgi:RNA polymerase sigma-70 factor, ECF subfamily
MADAEALFAAHQAALLKYMSRIVGHVDTARDLTQDVFVRVIKADAIPEPDHERRAWLFRIARNLAIDHHRQVQVRGTDVRAATEPYRKASQDTSLQLGEALQSLDDLDRDVFLMREVAGLSYAEIGSACDLTLSAVSSRMHRARCHLRDRLSRNIAERRHQPLRAR